MKEITIDKEELRKRKMMVATPMYGGQCTGMYTRSMLDLAFLACHHGLHMVSHFLFNESLIPRARNYLADEFIRSDCTHLMFIDSDIGFNPNDALGLLALADPTGDKQILCGPYPKKTISWEKIKMAVDKGFVDANPNDLEKFVGDYVFNPTSNTTEIRLDEPCEVMEGGTGFMMIQKNVFTKFKEAYNEQLSFKPDHIRTEHFDGSREIVAYFDTVICPKTKRYLSEDYMFCQWAREIGIKVWLCPWMKLTHVGTYSFGGSLEDIARIGASPTADARQMAEIKEIKRKRKNK